MGKGPDLSTGEVKREVVGNQEDLTAPQEKQGAMKDSVQPKTKQASGPAPGKNTEIETAAVSSGASSKPLADVKKDSAVQPEMPKTEVSVSSAGKSGQVAVSMKTEKKQPKDKEPVVPAKKNEQVQPKTTQGGEAVVKQGAAPVNRAKMQEIRVLDIAPTSLEDCLACGKSVKELRDMGLSEEEIKKAVKEKLERLNQISAERRKAYEKKKEVDFSGIKDCVACG
ncbi:MAG: hypothetical protein ACE5FU_10590, partial [Nitrospinota bacterium]